MAVISKLEKQNRKKIYEGSGKDVFQPYDDDSTLILFFKDELYTHSEETKISGKGVINNSISSFMMQKLDMVGIQNHFIEKINMREQLIQILDILPVQVKITNVAVDDYVQNYGIQEGYLFENSMIEFRVKNKAAGNPIINESQITGFNWATYDEIKEVKKLSLRVNDFLSGYFAGCGFRLIEGVFEFGRVFNGEDFIFMLADEITPETCRLWDLESNERFDLDAIIKAENPAEKYKSIAQRLEVKN